MQSKRSQAVQTIRTKLLVRVQVKTAVGDLAPQHAEQKTIAGATKPALYNCIKAIRLDSLI